MKKYFDKSNVNFPFTCFFVISLLVHFLLPRNWADDLVFKQKAAEKTFSEFMSGSARPISDSVTYIFAKYPFFWRLLNPVVLIIFIILISKIFFDAEKATHKRNIFLCILLTYPALVVVDAGFIATTVNYLWPATCGLYCLFRLKNIYDGQKVGWYDFLIAVPLTAYVTNMQQLGAIIAAVYLVFTLYMLFIRKHFCLFSSFLFLLTSAGIGYSYYINTNGDNNRMLRSTTSFFPEFDRLNIFQKAELGFSSTFHSMMVRPHFALAAFALFSAGLIVFAFRKNLKGFKKAVTFAPLALTLLLTVSGLFPQTAKLIFGEYKNYGLEKAVYSFELLPDAVYCITALCVLASLYFILSRKSFIASFILLLCGLGSRMIMGFSPTVWASGYRTFFIIFTAFAIITVLEIEETEKLK